ncbi:Cytochrome b5 heme-binding domain-containing protein [Meloidogyne graminicola]|uniref:Cytochrome b5 n=1 Tax=Meloidogyne graminicola TaxID=189291 RepID=A0A8S9ZJ81_9BILA|nr:Cytochrome b5 heme-binding domain-containing protein [Meloidogyne graminicola]
MKHFSRSEVASHISEKSVWIILDNKVYDVTKFLLEHPGGEDVLIQWAGQDATERDVFNEVGHSADARAMTNDYLIGELHDEGTCTSPLTEAVLETESWKQIITSQTWTNLLIPVALSFGVFLMYKLFK